MCGESKKKKKKKIPKQGCNFAMWFRKRVTNNGDDDG